MNDGMKALARWHAEHLRSREPVPAETEERWIARENLANSRAMITSPTVGQVDKEVERMRRATREATALFCKA